MDFVVRGKEGSRTKMMLHPGSLKVNQEGGGRGGAPTCTHTHTYVAMHKQGQL